MSLERLQLISLAGNPLNIPKRWSYHMLECQRGHISLASKTPDLLELRGGRDGSRDRHARPSALVQKRMHRQSTIVLPQPKLE